jgi:hypothetical protein
MAWWIKALEIADAYGKPTGRWRMTAKSDEDGGGPYGDNTHDHASADEARACEKCDKYMSRIAGFLPRTKRAEMREIAERQQLAHLKAKYPDAR